MKIFDRYLLRRPKLASSCGNEAVLPVGTIGSVIWFPERAKTTPFQLDIFYQGNYYKVAVERDDVVPAEGNEQVQQIMEIIPAIQVCIEHTKRNVGEDVVTLNNVLHRFYGEIDGARYLPPDQMRARLETLRERATFHSYEEEQYEKRWNEYAKIRHDVAIGHREYLLRVVAQFLETGVWEKQLCRHVFSHTLDKIPYGPQPKEGVLTTTYNFAEVQATKMLEQEIEQEHPYPYRYAAYIIYERLQVELFRNGYNYRDLAYEEQQRIVDLRLLQVGYPGAEYREIEKPFWLK